MKITDLSYDELISWLRTQASLLGVDAEKQDYLTLIDIVYDGIKCGRLATPYFTDMASPVVKNKEYNEEEIDELFSMF
jgi:hypothetical protein